MYVTTSSYCVNYSYGDYFNYQVELIMEQINKIKQCVNSLKHILSEINNFFFNLNFTNILLLHKI